MNYPPRDRVSQILQMFLNIVEPVLAATCLAGIVVFILALPVWLLWNWVMPGIFGVREISLLQALGLNLLLSLLLHCRLSINTKG